MACLVFGYAYQWLSTVIIGLWTRQPFKQIALQSSNLAEQQCSWENLLRFVLITVIISCFAYGTDHLKALIPYFHPFEYDTTLLKLDKMLLLGHSSWHWIKTLGLYQPQIVQGLDVLYLSWFLVLPYALITSTMTNTLHHTQKILIAYISTWLILGIGMATLFASVGPCFLDLVHAASPTVTAQMQALSQIHQTHPLIALDEQKILHYIWHHLGDTHHIGASISAFPSLHVGCAAIVYKICKETFPKITYLAGIYVGMTWLGSVVLGWHYFCDGLFAIIGVHWIWEIWTPWLMRIQRSH